MAKKSKHNHYKNSPSDRADEKPFFDPDKKITLYCSFCGKSQHEVRKLIAGPNVFVCNECTNLLTDIVDDDEHSRRIVREIHLDPAHVTTVSQILSNFSKFLKDKYPDNRATVRIEQDGDKIRMVIKTDDGHIDQVEESLEQYALVMSGRLDPSEVLDDKIQIMDLKNQRDQAILSLKYAEEQKQILLQVNSALSTENQRLSSSNSDLVRHATQHVELNKSINETLIHMLTHARELTKKLDEISNRQDTVETVKSLLAELTNKINIGVTARDKDEIVAIINEISKSSPSIAREVYEFIKSSASGAAGAMIVKWIEVAPLLARIIPN